MSVLLEQKIAQTIESEEEALYQLKLAIKGLEDSLNKRHENRPCRCGDGAQFYKELNIIKLRLDYLYEVRKLVRTFIEDVAEVVTDKKMDLQHKRRDSGLN